MKRNVLLASFIILCAITGSLFSQMIVKDSDENELMRVFNDGRVGIGTSAPLTKLHVQGETTVSSLGGSGETWVKATNDGTLIKSSVSPGPTQLYSFGWLASNQWAAAGTTAQIRFTDSGGLCSTNGTITIAEDGLYNLIITTTGQNTYDLFVNINGSPYWQAGQREVHVKTLSLVLNLSTSDQLTIFWRSGNDMNMFGGASPYQTVFYLIKY
jgi:hypothetical protein